MGINLCCVSITSIERNFPHIYGNGSVRINLSRNEDFDPMVNFPHVCEDESFFPTKEELDETFSSCIMGMNLYRR